MVNSFNEMLQIINNTYHSIGDFVRNGHWLVAVQSFQFGIDFFFTPDMILLTTTVVTSHRVVALVLSVRISLVDSIDFSTGTGRQIG